MIAATILPFVHCMSGYIYLATALVLGAGFFAYAWRMYRNYSDALAQKTFRYSIIYLSILFAALLVDHYFKFGPAVTGAAAL
jgi:protoheme IX farnesyltransferase